MRCLAAIAVVACVSTGCDRPLGSTAVPSHHVLKRSDVIGVDPVRLRPETGPEGKAFTKDEIVDLTLLNIVKQNELVARLEVFDRHLGDMGLSKSQRLNADRTVAEWPDKDQEAYYRAAAIVIEAIKKLNPGLRYDWLLTPGRKIVLPDPATF